MRFGRSQNNITDTSSYFANASSFLIDRTNASKNFIEAQNIPSTSMSIESNNPLQNNGGTVNQTYLNYIYKNDILEPTHVHNLEGQSLNSGNTSTLIAEVPNTSEIDPELLLIELERQYGNDINAMLTGVLGPANSNKSMTRDSQLNQRDDRPS